MRRRVSGSVVILLVATVLFHGTVSVPQSSWRSMDVQVDEPGSIFTCVFSVPREASRVQAMLVTHEQAERFRQGRSFRWVAGSGFERSGHFSHEIERAGPYVLLFDSRLEGRRATSVSVRLSLRRPGDVEVRTVSRERRLVVVLCSVLFVLAVVSYAARRILR